MAAYLTNKQLLEEITLCKRQSNTPSKVLGQMMVMMTNKYSQKANFCGYSYLDDMKAEALLALSKGWHKFDESRSNNPFAFFTQIIKNAFLMTLNKEKQIGRLKDEIRMEHGLDPSWGYEDEHQTKKSQ